MLYMRLPVLRVRRVLGVVFPIELHRDEAFPLAGRQVVCRADMNPLAIDKQLGKAMKAINPLDPPVLGDF
jgi:hypothetical protein